jgi:CheY-like chemotaxis protein
MSAKTRSSGPRQARPDVLLVEDNEDGRESLRLLLTMLGFTVEAAADGEEGVRLGLELRPLAAVLDVGLPGMDGYEVARRLRAGLDGGVLLIAHTAWSGPEGRERAKAAGFDALLGKPADVREMARLLRKAA